MREANHTPHLVPSKCVLNELVNEWMKLFEGEGYQQNLLLQKVTNDGDGQLSSSCSNKNKKQSPTHPLQSLLIDDA